MKVTIFLSFNIDFLYLRIILDIMDIRVFIEFDSELQSYSAYCPELPGCASAGFTEEEALENIHEAIDLYFTPDEISPASKKVYNISV